VQQHENLQLSVASQVDQLWQHVVTHSSLFARISKPLWLNIRSTGAEVAGGQKTFYSNGRSTLNVSLCANSTQLFCLNFTLYE